MQCDGDFSCKDGSDEDDCECPSRMFYCQGGGCIPATAVCDGTYDCYNGDDEKNCRKLDDPLLLTEVQGFQAVFVIASFLYTDILISL